ncbi:hypothetical protein [Flavobacterium sp. 5]|uniref:hypothetical protein n=1 Tax=Flavobacterium sp. 5 TaxID=2035199 RepID=UPI000C2BF59D|nr:hypothetical protein [Flavobacterium sp. 5]PKB17836.1 hypothetical protein CLU82_3081 [Flavobacterium sp. 5]
MKTNALITQKTSLYFLIGFLSLIITSCGSYQNSSYYDSDGIYSTNGDKVVIKDNKPTPASIQYKEYFNSLQNTAASGEIFTDVNSYSNDYNTENDSIQAPPTGYASWGSSPQETTVTVYPDSYWSIGFGWGYPYYGYGYGYPYYGWGYPYYGYGYPGYGWGYPGYGYPGCGYSYATPYAYNYGRRGSSYSGYNTNRYYNNNRVTAYNRNSVSSRSFTNRNSVYNNNSYNRNRTNNIVNRQAPTFTNRNNYSTNSTSRNYNQSQSRSNYTQNRANTSSQNYQRSSYTPSNNSYRSSGSGMSSGGGRMSSGGGGGRTSGGGGRR